MAGDFEEFEVVEVSERHGFARVRSSRTGMTFHTELVPEGQAQRLRVGDRVRGLQRGQSVGRVTWVSRAQPEASALSRATAVLADLGKWGLQLPMTPEQLADAESRAKRGAALTDAIQARLIWFFDEREEADGSLFERFEQAMAPHIPGFKVFPVAREAKVVVEPGAVMVQLGPVADPASMFEPLIAYCNERLEAAGAKVRWVPTRRNWLLAPPALVRLLQSYGAVQPQTVH